MHSQSKPTLPQPHAERRIGVHTLAQAANTLVSRLQRRSYASVGAGRLLTIEGNVDVATGNIYCPGDLHVLGDVNFGHTVEAEGDILVDGCMVGARVVSHGGDVRIRQGAIGLGKGSITAKGSIHLSNGEHLTLECGGILEVEKGLRDCRVTAGSVKADGNGCYVVGGRIKSYSDVRIAVLGREGCWTEVRIADRLSEQALLRMPDIDWRKKRARSKMKVLEEIIKHLSNVAHRLGPKMSQRMRNDFLSAREEYGQAKKELESVGETWRELLDAYDSHRRHTGTFMVTEKVVAGAAFNAYGYSREIHQEDAGDEWGWTPDGLARRKAS